MSRITEGEVFKKITEMLNTSYAQGYQDALNTKQSKLYIPRKIAEKLDEDNLTVLAWTHGNDLLGKVSDTERNAECKRRDAIAKIYLASKVLGVELVKVTDVRSK
ncbi:hypothetical protein ACRPK2_08690 [Lactococcus garvieae]|uniref:hypothetical protein n=1 Tax=Lactococcus garvieae TaxID=1363 RepID=UPI003D78B00F